MSRNCAAGYEGCRSGELQITSGHLGFLNMHITLNTFVFFFSLLNFTPIGMQPPQLGIEPATSCSVAEHHSHRANVASPVTIFYCCPHLSYASFVH